MPTVRRVVSKSTTRKGVSKTSKPPVESVFPGDKVEYGLSTNVQVGNRKEVWVRAALTTTAREGESTAQVRHRLTQFVEGFLDSKIEELTS